MALYEVVLPELGEGVLEGEVQKWLVSSGDWIQEDQALVEVMTDKAMVEVPSPVSGRVQELKIKAGQVCSVGHTLALVEIKEKEKEVQAKQESAEETAAFDKDEKTLDRDESSEFVESKSSVRALPMVRKKAQEWGVNLNSIQGTGLAGRITLEDLKKARPSKPAVQPSGGFSIPVEGEESRIPLKGVRKKIAEKMQLSKNVIPHFTLMEQARVEELCRLKDQSKKLHPDIKITYLSFIIKILHRCLLDFPELNAGIDSQSEEIVYKKYYNIGVAVDTPKGLLVPVVKGVDQKSVIDISKEVSELAERARNSKITVDEMKGATITVTNIGSIAGQWATPIINPPETAILGMYRISTNPVWDGSCFQPVRTMNFSLTADHRLIDGALSARFMSQFVERVEKPSLILIDG